MKTQFLHEATSDAKRMFVLADRLKGGPFDTMEHFLAAFERYSVKVAALTTAEIDSLVGVDAQRLCDYNRADWRFDTLDLGECCVWPRMGNRTWAQGRVTEVAKLFETHEPKDSRVWSMKQFADIYSLRLPVIVLKTRSETRIDDGSHRAIAMALTGIRKVSAWVGILCA